MEKKNYYSVGKILARDKPRYKEKPSAYMRRADWRPERPWHNKIDHYFNGFGQLKVWLKKDSDEYFCIAGYFMMDYGNMGPLEDQKWLNFEYHWVLLDVNSQFWNSSVRSTDEEKIQDFKNYLDKNGIIWL